MVSRRQATEDTSNTFQKITIIVPVDAVGEGIKGKRFSFKNEEGGSLLRINHYKQDNWKDIDQLPSSLKYVNEDFFYVAKDEDEKIGFYTSIIKGGRKTIGGSLNLRSSEYQSGFLCISPLEGYEAKGTGYRVSSFSQLERISEKMYMKLCDDNLEFALVMNAIIERNMIDLNSSFFTSDVGRKALSDYLNNIYNFYNSITKPVNMDLYDLEYHIMKFINDREVSEYIINERNKYDELYLEYREIELFCILSNDEFNNRKESLISHPVEEYKKYNKLVEEFDKINYHDSLGNKKMESTKNDYLETNSKKTYNPLKILLEARNSKKSKKLLDIKRNQLERFDNMIGREELYNYNVNYKLYEDIDWYYNRHKEIFPVYSPDLNPKEMGDYKRDRLAYEKEYNHYLKEKQIINFEDDIIEPLNVLEDYESREIAKEIIVEEELNVHKIIDFDLSLEDYLEIEYRSSKSSSDSDIGNK